MSAALLLASTFALVFCLGLQSQLVNNQHYIAAFLNSLAIGTCNLVLFKLAPNASGLEIAAYLAGGPFGIVCAMAAYRHHRRRADARSNHPSPREDHRSDRSRHPGQHRPARKAVGLSGRRGKSGQ